MVPCSDSAEPRGRVSRLGRSPSPFNLSRRRLCNPLGRSLGCATHCCAISVARARAALTAAFPRSSRSSARRASFGAAKSCSLVTFIISLSAPPTATVALNNIQKSRPSHGRELTRSLRIPSPSHEQTVAPTCYCPSGNHPLCGLSNVTSGSGPLERSLDAHFNRPGAEVVGILEEAGRDTSHTCSAEFSATIKLFRAPR
jgi:hypothetical protein